MTKNFHGASLDENTFARIKPLERRFRFIPTGGGNGKSPLISKWSEHPGFTVQELQEKFPRARSLGVITQPLLCFDFDGETAIDNAVLNGRDPDCINTWRINRTTDPNRFKLLFLLSEEQLGNLPNRQYTGKTINDPACVDTHGNKVVFKKGEAEEIFCHPGRQVIVAGAHPKSGGHYFWPVGFGPEALSAPPENWWNHVLELSRDYPRPAAGANKTITTNRFDRSDWERISHCPICGRGPSDNPICQLHHDGETLRCFLGQTFSPPTNLARGQLVSGTDWAFSSKSSSGWGNFLTFVKDKPNRYQQIKSGLRRWKNVK